MDLNEARAILKNPNASTLHEHAAAATYLSSFYRHEGRPLLRPALTKDAAGNSVFREGREEVRRDYVEARRPPHVGKIGGGDYPSGPEIVAVLEGPATAYSILTDEQGRTVLVRHSRIGGQHDPGKTVTGGASFIADARRRAAAEQKRNKEWAAGISDFWKKQQAPRA
jgi:hypothetical protein